MAATTANANTTANTTSTTNAAAAHRAGLPAYAYFLSAGIALAVFLGGTAVQVQTSEDWITHVTAGKDALLPHFSVYSQIAAFWSGGLTPTQVVAYTFGWAVQAALILFSIGVELPIHTRAAKLRAGFCKWACIVLIAVNSLGDFYYSAAFGFWGQVGFSAAVFVTTFCFGYIVIHALHKGVAAMAA